MTSPRQRELKNLMDKRTYILVLAFLCFWAPLLYFWVWMLEPLNLALFFSLGFGLGGTGFLYALFWRPYGRKIDRLLKYSVLFGPFFEAMITDMEENDAEKGDSWLTMEIGYLRSQQNRKIHQIQKTEPHIAHLSEQPKLANYCAMLYLSERYAEEETGE